MKALRGRVYLDMSAMLNPLAFPIMMVICFSSHPAVNATEATDASEKPSIVRHVLDVPNMGVPKVYILDETKAYLLKNGKQGDISLSRTPPSGFRSHRGILAISPVFH